MPAPSKSRTARVLKVRRIAIDTYRENVAYLHRECSVYRTEGFRALSKIEITAGQRHILAVLNVVDDDSIVARDELGLSDPAFAHLGAKPGARVDVSHPERPASMEVLANVEFKVANLRRIVRRHRGCIAWGGTARLSPADDVLVAVERPLGIDSRRAADVPPVFVQS